jgi:hypothetical protein
MMIKYAILNPENVVINYGYANEQDINKHIAIWNENDCQLGWIYDSNYNMFNPPKWTAYEFLLRLTPEERADIRERAKTDPNVADFLMLCQSAQEVISNDPVTVMGMNYMVAIGVFTEQRKKEILQILE